MRVDTMTSDEIVCMRTWYKCCCFSLEYKIKLSDSIGISLLNFNLLRANTDLLVV
jgi:hypothetical protein